MQAFRRLLFAILALASGQALASVFSNMVVLGDSLSDNGKLFILTTGTIPEPQFYFQDRFQNGPAYSELLYDELGLPGGLTSSLPGGSNYAFGGARSRYHVTDLDTATGLPPPLGNNPMPLSLLGQLGSYQTTVSGIADPCADTRHARIADAGSCRPAHAPPPDGLNLVDEAQKSPATSTGQLPHARGTVTGH